LDVHLALIAAEKGNSSQRLKGFMCEDERMVKEQAIVFWKSKCEQFATITKVRILLGREQIEINFSLFSADSF